MRQRMGKRMRTGLCVAAIFAITALLCCMLIHVGHDWGDDFAQYLSQGAALLNGTFDQWLAASRYINANSPVEMAVSLYPWGFPLLLAVVGRVFGDALLTYKLLQAALLALTAALCYLLCVRSVRPWLAAVAGVCFGVNYAWLCYVNSILSEPLFLLLELIFFLLVRAWLRDPERHAGYSAAVGAAAFLAYLTRSQGICLLLALFGYQLIAWIVLRFFAPRAERAFAIPETLFRTKRAWISNALPYAVFALLFAVSKWILPQNPDSSLYFLAHVTPATLWQNLLYYPRLLVDFFPFSGWMAKAACALCLACMLFGLIARRGKDLVMLLFAAGMFGMNVIFPWSQGVRYLLPVLPVFLLYTLYGVDALLQRVRLPRWLAAVLAVLLCCLMGYRTLSRGVENLVADRAYDSGPYSGEAQAVFSYIRDELPEDASVVFFKPRLLYYMTGRKGFRADADPERIARGDYLLYTSDYGEVDYEVLQRSIEAYRAAGGALSLKLVFHSDRYELYQIVRE